MPDIACINGSFMPLAEARVPIEDRGYQFADGVYEVIVAPQGTPFLLEGHLERLRDSLAGIDLTVDLDALKLPSLIAEGIERCQHRDVMIYIQITRGTASRDHVYTRTLQPTLVMTFKPRPKYDPALKANGVALMTVQDIRWAKCNIKSIALLPSVLLKNQARAAGFYDALIVSPDDVVRETSAANVFAITAGVLRTPPRSTRILPGITRSHLLECAPRMDIRAEERDFTIAELRAADEVFITSTTMNVMPVTKLDDAVIGAGQVGPITRKLEGCFPS